MKILTIIGARPQFIKAAAISRLLKNDSAIQEVLVHTGQHYDNNMSELFFQELEIPTPKYNLAIGSGSHGTQTGHMLMGIEDVMLAEKPDLCLIYGDTNSTLAGAIAASKLHIPIAHVEAGLRSFNRKMPEEVNRVVSDHLATWLFAPTSIAVENLKQEGIAENKIHPVGDVMYDIALYYGKKAIAESQIIQRLQLTSKNYYLCTIHRAENTDHPERLECIVNALCELSKSKTIVLPLHPRTNHALKKSGLFEQLNQHIKLIDPIGFLDMIALETDAELIITDSGGVQKEAYFHKVPCVTLRDETEWLTLVKMGWNTLTPPLSERDILTGVKQALTKNILQDHNPYGNGDSADKIISILSNDHLNLNPAAKALLSTC